MCALLFMTIIINSCFTGNSSDDDDEDTSEGITENPIDTPTTTDTSTTTAKVAQYFWGTWQSMANGKLYLEISENSVNSYIIDDNGEKTSPSSYSVSSSTDDTLVVQTLGTYTKQSDSVMLKGSIPFFRKGGANLSYTMKLVGFDDTSSARVASSASLAGYTVTGTSNTYTSFKSETTSDAEGNISLTAPVSGDVQTVTVSSGESNIAVVPGITVENNNSNMGTIPISTGGEYSLKITGTINESDKSDGYLYSGKSYPMTLTITNISEVGSAPSWCTIEAADSSLSVIGTTSFMISSLEPNLTKTVNLTVSCSSTSSYVDTGLNVRVRNLKTEKTWTDYVPIRFYKGLVPITIATKSTENNSNAALNGFFIYPDGNSKFFQVPQGSYKTLYILSFGDSGSYKLAFSGATIEGSLSNSTEMAYTVAIGTTIKKDVDISTENLSMAAVQYGESGSGNETEDTAYSVSEDFTAYIAVKDIDFYTFNANGSNIIAPENINKSCTITYQSEFGTVPSTQNVDSGTTLSETYLPTLTQVGQSFTGWYIGEYKVESGYIVKSNITLTAKWDLETYNITYNLNNGTNSTNNPATYTTEDETITLSEPTRNGYVFDGWYTSSDFTRSSVTQINTSNSSDITLYAKWIAIEYSISYSLNGGTNDSNNPSTYTIESDSITLAAPSRSGYEFAGWYESAKFSGSAVTSIPTASYGNITLYAKWKSSSGISVSIVGNSDIKVSKTSRNNGTELVFTADSGYDSYSWKLDDVEKSTSSTYVLSTSNLAKGYYLLSLEAKKGSKWHSYTVQVTIE